MERPRCIKRLEERPGTCSQADVKQLLAYITALEQERDRLAAVVDAAKELVVATKTPSSTDGSRFWVALLAVQDALAALGEGSWD